MKDIIHKSKLPNGMTAYLRKTDLAPNHISLALSVKAGSFHDAENKGIAHLLEHCNMGFEKYRQPFPPLNYRARAYTDYYSTNYIFTCKKEEIETVISILQELLLGNYLKQGEFSEIKQDVLAEFDRKLENPEYRSLVKFFENSMYAEKLPVGDREIVRMLSLAQVKAFFYKWYVPEQMVIMGVGDLPKDMEEKLGKLEFPWKREEESAISARSEMESVCYEKKDEVSVFYDRNKGMADQIHYFYLLPAWKLIETGDTQAQEQCLKMDFLYDFCSDVLAKTLDGRCGYRMGEKGCQRSFFAPYREIMHFEIIRMENMAKKTEKSGLESRENVDGLRQKILSFASEWLSQNFEKIKVEYQEAFRHPQDYISVKQMLGQCIDHALYGRNLVDYLYENQVLSSALSKIEKSMVENLLKQILCEGSILVEKKGYAENGKGMCHAYKRDNDDGNRG